jgi:hypothetical protein
MPAFAALEARLAAATVSAFANIVLTDGAYRYSAVLDRGVERVGEYGQFTESRDQLSFDNLAAPALTPGLALNADPDYYSANDLVDMPRRQWTLDALQSDDGRVSVWWTR